MRPPECSLPSPLKRLSHKLVSRTFMGLLGGWALAVLLVGYVSARPVLAHEPPRILILDSYHHGYSWSHEEIDGFLEQIRKVYPLVDPPVDHLDAKRHPEKENLFRMKEMLLHKYADHKIDLIAAFDNASLEMLCRYGDELFPGIPVVFGGVNDFATAMLRDRKGVTGVAEIMDYKKTLDIALKLHPHTQEIFVIYDHTRTGLAVRREIEAIVPEFSSRVRFRFMPPSTFNEAVQQVRELPRNTLILLVAFTTDRLLQCVSLAEGTHMLALASRVPMYGLIETRLGHGIVGGQLIGGRAHGRRVGEMALRVLRGEKPESIPIDKSGGSSPMFDYEQLQRFNVAPSALPSDSVVINKPVSFFTKYRTLTIGTLTVLTTLAILVISLATSLMRLRGTKRNLEKSEANYRRIVETANEGVWVVDAAHRTTFINRRMADMLGYSTQEMVGRRVDSFLFAEDLANHEEQVRARHVGESSSYERRLVKRDGQPLWTTVSATPIMDSDGRFRGAFGMLTDIAERKRMDDELKQSEELYRNLFEQARRQEELYQSLLNCSADPIVVYDAAGKVQYLNPAHTDLFGWTLEEVQGQRLTTLPETDGEATCTIIDRILTRGAVHQSYDTQRLTKDGRLVDVSVSGARYLDHEGNPAGMLFIIRDISDRKRVEESLRESEERFRLAFENANIGVCILAPDGKLLRINDQMCEMLGYDRARLESMTLNDISHPDDAEISTRFTEKACAGEIDRAEFEKRYIHKLGHVVEGNVSSSLVKDGHGRPLYFIAHIQDVTRRRQTERALKESERRLSTLMANLPGMAYRCVNEPAWTMKFISEGCMALTGYIPTDLMDNRTVSYGDLIHPEDREGIWRRVQEALAADKPFEVEYRIRTLSRDEKWVWERGRGISLGGTSEIQLEGFISDITERKHIEHALQESEERYRAVVDNLQIGISVINPQMEIIAVNKAFQKMHPLVRPGLGQICYETYPHLAKPTPCPNCPCAKTFRDGTVHEHVAERLSGGRMRNYRVVSCPIKDARGHVELVIELVEDITDTRELQLQLAQAQKLEAVGTLAGGIAHDFNNLLQVVLGYSDLMLDDVRLPTEFRGELYKVRQAAQNGADLVKRLLTFSRKTEYKPRPVNLNRRIEQLQSMISRTIPKMIATELDLTPEVLPVNADPTQVDQILMNLILNSQGAMPDGGRLIIGTENVVLDDEYCKTKFEAKPGPYVRLSVSDTGQGMDKDTLEHIFEPFFTTKETGKGTGLGLAMVYGIVQQHGGHIRCFSEPGAGTTFEIYFPAIMSHEQHEERQTAGVLPSEGSGVILLVDDEPTIRDLCARMLTRTGFHVITASNGKEALKRYAMEEEYISLVILDLIMPEMSGKQCLKELMVLNPSVKVVIASGCWAEESDTNGLAGAKAFVAKPYDLRQLLKVVRDVLDEQ